MNGLKRMLHSRRGFTLVELVVVLVILGVVGSIGVPALTGYIDNGKEKQAVSEAQACVIEATRQGAQNYALVQNASVAGKAENATALTRWAGELQTEAPEVKGGTVALTEGSGTYLLHVEDPPAGSIATTTIAADAGVKGTVQGMTCNASGQVLYLVYTSADGIQVVYKATGSTASVDADNDVISVPTPEPTAEPTPEPEPEPEEPTLTVTVYKKDADDKTKDVIGAQLVISGDSGTINLVSKAGGNSVTLKAGNYTLTETSAPDDYELASAIQFSIVDTNGVLHVSGDNTNATSNSVTMYDKKKSTIPSYGDLRVTILDSDNSSNGVAGIKYILKRTSANTDNFNNQICTIYDETNPLVSDASGTVSIPVINPYYIKNNPDDQKHAAADWCMYELIPIYVPDGRQEVFSIQFQIVPFPGGWDGNLGGFNITSYRISAIFTHNNDYRTGGLVDTDDPDHHLVYYNDPVRYLTVNVLDAETKQPVSGSSFKFTFSIKDSNGKEYSEEKKFTPVSSSSYRIALKFHDGDGIYDIPFFLNYGNLTIQQTASPSCYTLIPDIHLQVTKDGLTAPSIYGGGNASLYASVSSEPYTLDLYDWPGAAVTINKIDDKGKLLSGAAFTVTTSDGAVINPNNGNKDTYYQIYNNDFKGTLTLYMTPGHYTLTETQVPNGYTSNGKNHSYTKSDPISFTVEKNTAVQTVTMTDHDTQETGSDFTLGNITFTDCQNWSNKLTDDNGIKFNSEFMYWQGKLYWDYRDYTEESSKKPGKYETATVPNLNRESYKSNDSVLSNAPNPIDFLQNYLDTEKPKSEYSSANSYLVCLTGVMRSSTTPAADFMRGDMIQVFSGTRTQLYVYVGNDHALEKVPQNKEDIRNDDTNFFLVNSNKYKSLG